MMPSPDKRAMSDILSPGLLAELRRIELKARRSIDSGLMGNYRSAFRGSGLVFSDLREYLAGDDVKHIHWKVTARTGKAFVKSFEEDRQLRVIVAVDISNSTDHGAQKTKHLKALEFAAVIAMLAQKSHDQIGLCLFSDEVEEFLPPGHSRRQFQSVLLSILKHRTLRRGTNIAAAMKFLVEKQRKSSVVFFVSDFLDAKPFTSEVRSLAHRHDLTCVLLDDSLDAELPKAGIVEFFDAESGKRFLVDTSAATARQQLSIAHRRRYQALSNLCSLGGADFMQIKDSTLRPLADLMRRRHARVR